MLNRFTLQNYTPCPLFSIGTSPKASRSGNQSSCSRQPDNCFSLLHTRCPTIVVQLPHNCGATAPQLWCNCPTPVGQRKSPLEKQKEGAKNDISPLIHYRKIRKTHARFMSQNILASESSAKSVFKNPPLERPTSIRSDESNPTPM